MNLSFVMLFNKNTSVFYWKKRARKNFFKFFLLFLKPRSVSNFHALQRNQKKWAEVRLGVIIPFAKTELLHLYLLKPSVVRLVFIGSLVSSRLTTIIADIIEISLFILVQTFYNYKSTPSFATEYSFFIVSFCSKISLTHFV